MGSQDSWWTIPVASLVIVVSAVLVLSCGHTYTDVTIEYYTQRSRDASWLRYINSWLTLTLTCARRQTRMNALLSRHNTILRQTNCKFMYVMTEDGSPTHHILQARCRHERRFLSVTAVKRRRTFTCVMMNSLYIDRLRRLIESKQPGAPRSLRLHLTGCQGL